MVEEEKGGKSESGLYSRFQLKSKSGMEAGAVSFSSELETRIQTDVWIVKNKLPLLDLAAELFLNCISGCI